MATLCETGNETIIHLPYNPQRSLQTYNAQPRPYKPAQEKKKTFRDWHTYNLSQAKEKLLAYKILASCFDAEPILRSYQGIGRPPHQIKDVLKACAMKVYTGFSYRRLESELHFAQQLGYLDKIPQRTSINECMADPKITPFLSALITKLATPLVSYEKRFSVDATGFSAPNKKRWSTIRMKHQEHKDYKKLHIMIGHQTHTITAATVTPGNVSDTVMFPELLAQTKKHFTIKSVCADKGYLSRYNVQLIEDAGGTPYIMPKKNVRSIARGHYPAWRRMINLWKKNEPKFRAFYHQRSRVESTFWQVKSKFFGNIKSKTHHAAINEILFKCICHNLATLIKTSFEAKIDLHELA